MMGLKVERAMKMAGLWVLVIAMYMILYRGIEEGLWPMIAHFRHIDRRIPEVMDGVVGSVLGPFIVGCLFVGTLRRQLADSPWPILIAPSAVVAVLGYTSDSFYPPWRTELLTRLAGGAIQGACMWAGWFVYRRLSRWHLTPAPQDKTLPLVG